MTVLPVDVNGVTAQIMQQRRCQQEIIQFLQRISSHLDALHIASNPPLAVLPPAPAVSSAPANQLCGGNPKTCEGFLDQCTVHFKFCAVPGWIGDLPIIITDGLWR